MSSPLAITTLTRGKTFNIDGCVVATKTVKAMIKKNVKAGKVIETSKYFLEDVENYYKKVGISYDTVEPKQRTVPPACEVVVSVVTATGLTVPLKPKVANVPVTITSNGVIKNSAPTRVAVLESEQFMYVMRMYSSDGKPLNWMKVGISKHVGERVYQLNTEYACIGVSFEVEGVSGIKTHTMASIENNIHNILKATGKHLGSLTDVKYKDLYRKIEKLAGHTEVFVYDSSIVHLVKNLSIFYDR